jgi:hypothetical protein
MLNQDISNELSSTDVEIHTWNGKDDPDNPYACLYFLLRDMIQTGR